VIPSSITAAEQELRRVIERRQASDITKCLAAFGEVAGNQVTALPLGDPIRLQICERVLSVLEWARLMLGIRRARLDEELALLRKADRFLGTGLNSSPRFRLDL